MTAATGRIVVGVDGSDASRDALGWALAEARLRGALVEVVHVWHYPAWADTPMLASPVIPHEDLEAEARAVVDKALEESGATGEASSASAVVLEGAAAEHLVERARQADLLVVGHRGRGGFAGLLLGSVAYQCATHATCPVVVVRHQDRRFTGS